MLLNKEKTETLKVFFSLAVLLCHVCSRSGVGANWGLGPIYTAMGFLSVSVFFSLSGYGLAFCSENKERYLQTFFRNRLVPLYVLSGFFIALYAILKWVLLGSIEINEIIFSFFLGDTVVSNGWYLQVILLYYILFFVIYSRNISVVSKKIYLFASIVVYIIISVIVGMNSTWWECALCFFLGFVLYGVNFVRKEIFRGALIASTLFMVSFLLYYSITKGWMDGWMDALIFKGISAVCFATMIFLFSLVLNIEMLGFKFLSKHYLEIYLLQGIAFMLARNQYWSIDNRYLYFVFSILLTFLLSYLIKPVTSWILCIFK